MTGLDAVGIGVRLLQELALVTWLGGLIYICFILPPMQHREALPPVFVRMMGLARFRVFSLVALGILFATAGLWPLVMVAGSWAKTLAGLRIVLLAACLGSSLQLYGFLAQAMLEGHDDPLPPICLEDPTKVDKLLRQVNKVCRALVFMGLAVLLLTVLG